MLFSFNGHENQIYDITWVNFDDIMPWEINKNKYSIILLPWGNLDEYRCEVECSSQRCEGQHKELSGYNISVQGKILALGRSDDYLHCG